MTFSLAFNRDSCPHVKVTFLIAKVEQSLTSSFTFKCFIFLLPSL